MIHQYYLEDHPDQALSDEQVERTLDEFLRHPEKGAVLLLLEKGAVLGYSILVYFWSNEMGGDIVNIDELFVKSEHRGKGLGTAFVKSLIEDRFKDCVRIELVTTPQNERARKLYSSLGFSAGKDFHMEYSFTV